MAGIPVYVLEEHNEAFLVWHYAVERGLIGREGNTLLHVDQHADMDLPVFNASLGARSRSLRAMRSLAYEELGIANFIVPALYQGVFRTVCWINHGYFQKDEPAGYLLYSLGGRGWSFALKRENPQNAAAASADLRRFRYRIMTLWDDLATDEVTGSADVLLDIDLDFFSCIKKPMPRAEVEVTKAEHDAFQGNRYHFLKLRTDCTVRAAERGGRYFLVFNDLDHRVPYGLEVPDETIRLRVEMLRRFLARSRLVPALVTVCRSRHSGFTPRDRWELIEREVLSALQAVYGGSREGGPSGTEGAPPDTGCEVHGIDECLSRWTGSAPFGADGPPGDPRNNNAR